jgi:hypothetical protein
MNLDPTPFLPNVHTGESAFESSKRTNEHGAEYWSARDLQLQLGYAQWRRFEQAIDRARLSCEQSGNESQHHFANAGKMIKVGKGGNREVLDIHLSRFACYLIAQNGDPRKLEIALAQKYFVVQTRRQELDDQLANDLERLELRKQAGEEFKMLSGAAILRIGGTLPEQIAPAEPIKDVEKRIKTAVPKLDLGEKDANGLLGDREGGH